MAGGWRRGAFGIGLIALVACTPVPYVEVINGSSQELVLIYRGGNFGVRRNLPPGGATGFHYYSFYRAADASSEVVLLAAGCSYAYEPTRWTWDRTYEPGIHRIAVRVGPDFSLSVLTPPMVVGRRRSEWMKAFDHPAFKDRPVRVDCRGT